MFQVNWFRKDSEGHYIWPGFGDNIRVLAWILARLQGEVGAEETPLGLLPSRGDIPLEGLDVSDAQWEELFHIDRASQLAEAGDASAYLDEFSDRVPEAIRRQLALLVDGLEARRLS